MRGWLLVLSIFLSACGLKGQLYLPSDEDPADAVPELAAPGQTEADDSSAPEEQDGEKPKKN